MNMANSSGSTGQNGGTAAGAAGQGTGTGASGAGGQGAGGGAAQIAIDVEFILVTPDQLRKVEFGLTKTIEGTDVLWTITFELFERASVSADFATDPDISLTVKVDPALNDDAELASNGLTPAQAAIATGPAAVAVKAANANQIPQTVANRQVQKAIQ